MHFRKLVNDSSKILVTVAMAGAFWTSACSHAGIHEDNDRWNQVGTSFLSGELSRERFEAQFPPLATRLTHDLTSPSCTNLWGHSLNFDEGAQKQIVPSSWMTTLYTWFQLTPPAQTNSSGRIIEHAGLQHSYGYLLSTIRTPFGMKRDRWINNEVEIGLKLPEGTLHPEKNPLEGFLTNISVLGISLSNSYTEAEKNVLLTDCASPSLSKHLAAHPTRTAYFHSEKIPNSAVRAETTLVEFLNRPANPAQENAYLLIYALRTSTSTAKLITLFPVNEGMLHSLETGRTNGETPRLRYNASLE